MDINNKLPKQKINAPKLDDVRYEPHRVAARLEGVVKNRGTKTKKKPKRD